MQLPFFQVVATELVSGVSGESEEQIRHLFEQAVATAPCIVFIDEIDSLCSTRSENESESARRIKTEFLIQMQGVGKDDQG